MTTEITVEQAVKGGFALLSSLAIALDHTPSCAARTAALRLWADANHSHMAFVTQALKQFSAEDVRRVVKERWSQYPDVDAMFRKAVECLNDPEFVEEWSRVAKLTE